MKKKLIATAVATAMSAAMLSLPAKAQELRIGFMTTLSGGAAIIGNQMRNAFVLGLEHQGWTEDGDELGGVPTQVLIGDDQREPDVAVQLANRWIRNDRVHIVGGLIWSNLLMAIRNPVVNSRTILMSMNAGAAPLAGRLCSKYFISTSWNNDQMPEAMGVLMNDDGLESVYLLAPNYQAGKDMLAGFRRTYEGNVTGETLFPLGARDYQAEIARVREADPSAIFVFAPGGMGIAFAKQWAASGLSDDIRFYSVFTIDWLTLGPIGEDAVGTYHTNFWNSSSENETNQRFIRDYIARHQSHPSHYAAQSYDAPALIAAAVEEVNGEVDNTLNLMRAMRSVDYPSIRGPYDYNVNGVPIQNFYRRVVDRGPDGNPRITTTGIVVANDRDSYWEECPARERIQ